MNGDEGNAKEEEEGRRNEGKKNSDLAERNKKRAKKR